VSFDPKKRGLGPSGVKKRIYDYTFEGKAYDHT